MFGRNKEGQSEKAGEGVPLDPCLDAPLTRRDFLLACGLWLGTLVRLVADDPPSVHKVFLPVVDRNFRNPEPGTLPELKELRFETYEQLRDYLELRDEEAGIDQKTMTEDEIRAARDRMRSLDPYRRAMAIVTEGVVENIEKLISNSVAEEGAAQKTWYQWLQAHYSNSAQLAQEAGFDPKWQVALDTVIVVPDEVAKTHRVRRLESEGEKGLTYHLRQHEIGPIENKNELPQPWDIDSLVVMSKEHAESGYPPVNGGYQKLCFVEGIGLVKLEGGIVHEEIGHLVGPIDQVDGRTRVGPLGDLYWSTGSLSFPMDSGVMRAEIFDSPDDVMTDPSKIGGHEGYLGLCQIVARAIQQYLDPKLDPFYGVQPDGIPYVDYKGQRKDAYSVFKKGYRILFTLLDGENLVNVVGDQGYLFYKMGADQSPEIVTLKRGGDYVVLDEQTGSQHIDPDLHEFNIWHAVAVIGGRLPFPIPRHFLNALALVGNWEAEDVQVKIIFDRDPRELGISDQGVRWKTHYIKNEEMERFPNRVAHCPIGEDHVIVWEAEEMMLAYEAGVVNQIGEADRKRKEIENYLKIWHPEDLQTKDPNIQSKQRRLERRAV